ncbi:SycD/LcrH family type III secretion system chaperone [Noviherbaspirillum sp. CPCC 100848]|uniref:SycD/LcrH family type III secretion system chaperone n=1 Tax=Noviherbaspirillum album TaxID=3080276 RepID=A0ABU6JC54_9BURK|nr:SycD/LcrH family type III secretion system chaperone [Noviherbaspirillum sp. CPCC 100848]MEC4720734.1 SycD/LcrH family type III secretion system chaperone [Noviherbaspirillum sp. CPCC 100848]
MDTHTMEIPAEKLAEQMVELFSNGGTLGDVYDYNSTDYEVVYALGSELYNQGRYSDAMKAFGFLVIHNQWEKRFVNAYAASLQMCKRYEDALQYYSLASVMDMRDPVPTFHTAECMIALGQLLEATQALEIVVNQCREEKDAGLKTRAQAMLDLISAGIQKKGGKDE